MHRTLLLVTLALVAGACVKTEVQAGLSDGCLLNSDCKAPLMCAFRRCHNACETSRDCPNGLDCRPADRPFNVCLLPDELKCARATACVEPLTCGPDGTCRTLCSSDADCLAEQQCVQGVCADGKELVNGKLPVVLDAGLTCIRNSDCAAGQLCSRGSCIAECVEDRDCAAGSHCLVGRCSGGRCNLNSECPVGQQCGFSGWCVPQCLTSRDCAGGLVCESSICVQPLQDAGVPDAGGGSDAGADAGPPQCLLNQDCPSPQWCDQGACRAPCASSGVCGTGRVCDPAAGVCVRSCAAGCGGLEVCDTSPDAGVDGGIGACVRGCDGTFRCPLGQVCGAAGYCRPQCLVTADCTSAHSRCQAGQCVFDGTCADDRDCPVDRMCVNGACSPNRPTSLTDAGAGQPPAFACQDVCDCRLGEWCSRGVCLPDAVPTAYFSADGGGTGAAPDSPSGDFLTALGAAAPGSVLALREGEHWATGLADVAVPQGVTLAGGFKVCAPKRWVRGDQLTTTLDLSSAVTVGPVPGVAVRSLTLVQHTNNVPNGALVMANGSVGLTVEQVKGTYTARGNGVGAYASVLQCTNCIGVRATDLTFQTSPIDLGHTLSVVQLFGGYGTLERLTFEAQPPQGSNVVAVGAHSLWGALAIRDVDVAGFTSQGTDGIFVESCHPLGLTIERARIGWQGGGGAFRGVVISTCPAATVRDVLVDGSGLPMVLPPSSSGFEFGSAGVDLERAEVRFPTSAASVSVTGIYGHALLGLTVRDFTASGGAAIGQWKGLDLRTTNRGPLLLERISVSGGQAALSNALDVYSVPESAGLTVLDSTLESNGGTLCGSTPAALWLVASHALVERSRLRAFGGGGPHTVFVDATSTLELYASHVWTGVANDDGAICPYNTRPTALWTEGAVRVVSSTLDGEGLFRQAHSTHAVICNGTPAALSVTSSLLGGGKGGLPRVVDGPCPTSDWRQNYFWTDRPGTAADPADVVWQIVNADAGVWGDNGNLFNPNVSCYAAGQDAGPPYRLQAGSPCIDRGAIGTRVDSTPVLLDLDGQPRDAGAAPDIGCSEGGW